MSEGQDPQNRKDHMHTLNEWLGQEHATGYRAGYKQGRKEGIDELLQYATERKVDIRGSRYVALNIIEGGAERLKEQGK